MSSEIKATNYKAKDGTAGISIADSTGRVTFNENNPVISLGSNASGFTGVKTVDVWQLNADLAGPHQPIQAGKWTRGSTSSGAANLGTGMTLNGTGTDDGIFTFPSTGIWRVEIKFDFYLNNSARYLFTEIYVSTSGTSGTYNAKSLGKAYINRTDSNSTHTSSYDTVVLDVTTAGTSGTAIKVDLSDAQGTTTTNGSTTSMQSYLVFSRLGDT